MKPTTLLLIAFFMIRSVAVHSQHRIEVCTTCPVSSLTAAVDQANPFDTIVIQSGTYKEYNIIIDKPLFIRGINFPLFDGQLQGEIITITSDSVTVEGIAVANVGVSFIRDQAGIYLQEVSNCTIRNNRLINTFFGIYLEFCENIVVAQNYLEGHAVEEVTSANAIHLWRCKNISIHDNTATGHRDGIYLEFVDNSRIANNHVHQNLRYGLHFMFSNDDVYRENIFEDNGVGVAVMYSDSILMEHNQFIDNWSPISYGMLLKEIRYSTIRHNVFRKNTTGIYLESVIETLIEENTLKGNGWAVELFGSCERVTFRQNNFIANSFDLASRTNRNGNRFVNNYWSAYTGYDLNSDHIGDIPFRPVKLSSYLAQEIPTSIILLRSPFMQLLNHAEQVMPVLTPETLQDSIPAMKPVTW